MKRKKFFLIMGLCFCIPTSASAYTSLQSWDLVDSGKHMDYDPGGTKYAGYLATGASIWNKEASVIRRDTIFTIRDVYCYDVAVSGSTVIATTYSNGYMTFNTKLMNGFSEKKKINVATHELGHALRIDHLQSGDVMYKYASEVITLKTNDKESFKAARKKY